MGAWFSRAYNISPASTSPNKARPGNGLAGKDLKSAQKTRPFAGRRFTGLRSRRTAAIEIRIEGGHAAGIGVEIATEGFYAETEPQKCGQHPGTASQIQDRPRPARRIFSREDLRQGIGGGPILQPIGPSALLESP